MKPWTFLSRFYCFYLILFSPIFGAEKVTELSYPEFCQEAANDEAVLSQFRRESSYAKIFENASYEDGQAYLNMIRSEYPDLLAKMDIFRQNDSIGDPVVFHYGDIGLFSPTTLRHIKIAGDLRRIYGDRLKNMRIVEIGGSYGGLCRILSEIGGFISYTLVDLAECNQLSRSYLSRFGVSNVSFMDGSHLNEGEQYDLFICNFGFYSPSVNLHAQYLANVVMPTPNGYITYNENLLQTDLDSFSIEEIIAGLNKSGKRGMLVADGPLHSPKNQVLTWKPVDEIAPSVLQEKKICHPPIDGHQIQKAITYNFSGGRFGDNLVAYFHAKWLAREHGLPFLYKHFAYADLLKLHTMDQPLSVYTHYQHVWRITDKNQVGQAPASTLIIVPYFSESKFEYDMLNHAREGMPFFVIDWEDPEFHKEVVECLSPNVSVETLSLPRDHITVALHIRRGGAYESYADGARGYPLKFPPDSYYISQVQRIAQIYPDQKLYAYIFTDDLNPEAIAEVYAKAIQNPNIHWEWRPGKDLAAGSPSMLHDFYSMGKFDCLIRCLSNFSIIGSQLGNYSLMFSPTHAYFQNGEVIIDQVEIKFKDKNKKCKESTNELSSKNS